MSKKKATPKSPPTPPTKAKLGSPMDVDLLEQIIKLMSANDLNTVDVREGEKRIILKRGAVQQTIAYAPSHAPAPAPAPAGISPAAASASAPKEPPASADETAGLTPIKSPMVGTFYSAPSPDSKPFVQVGSTVNEETEVCTIEAMKNYMPIKAETRGTIAKINVTNGQTVQYDQVLFWVKP